MRILKVIPYYYPELKFGGPPLKVHSLARCLRAEGPHIRVLTFDSENANRSETVDVEGIEVTYLSWSGRGLRQWPRDLGTISRAVQESDLVHLYGLYTLICPVTARACRRHNKPYLCEPLGMYPPRQRNRFAKNIFNATLTKWMFSRAGKIVATSQPEFDDLAKTFPADQIVVRHNGIDIAAFRDLPPRESFLKRHELDPKRRFLTYLGRISPIKNLEEAIRAFKIAAPRDVDFLLIGPALETDYRDRLEAIIRELDLAKTVRILPPVYGDEKLEVLAATDLMILPSIAESFGNSAGEAVAAGVPVLVTRGCGIASIVDGRAGLAVDSTRAGLADGLRQLLSGEDTASQPVSRIQEAAGDLSWDGPVRETISLYKELLDGNPNSN